MSDKYAALRAAAEGAFSSWSRNVMVPTKEILTLLAEREADKARIAEQQEHINSLEEGVSMLLAQYDQLASAIGWTTEKALAGEGNQEQYAEAIVKRIAELENDEVRQRLANAEHQLHMAELAKHNLKASRKAQFKKRKAAEKRIAELETRKLEVIIPPRRCFDYAAVAVQQRDEQWYKALHDACDRAGINLETGGQ